MGRGWVSSTPDVRSAWRALDVVAGVALPLGLSRLLLLADDPSDYWPGGVLVAGVVALAVVLGRRACIAGAVTAVGCAWWWFVAPSHSLRLPGWPEALSLASMVVPITGVTILVLALERSRSATTKQLELVDAVMSATQVGTGVIDAEDQVVAMNERLAELAGVRPDQSLPLPLPLVSLPELSAIIGDAVERARISGAQVRNLQRTTRRGGLQVHHRLSIRPLDGTGGDRRLVLSVEDVTEVVRADERADLIARCAQELAGAATAGEVGEAVASVLAATFGAQVALAVPTDDRDHLELVHLEGYGADVERRWGGRGWQLDERHPICDALRAGEWLELADADQFDAAYPALASRRASTGVQTVIAIPLVGAVTRTDPLGVLQLAWTRRFTATEGAREYMELVASLAQMALARLELVALASRDEFRSALDSMIGEVTIGRAVRDENQRIVDFVVEFITAGAVAGTGRTVADMVGRRMLELVPHWGHNGFFDAIAKVVDTGEPLVNSRLPVQVASAAGGQVERWWSVQVTRFRDGYLLAWRDVTDDLEVERVAQGARESALRELAAVGVLQEASLPKVMPADPRLELIARYEPVSAEMPVGGDWYDVFLLDDGRLGLVIADVAGHGRAAASDMVQLRNKLRGASFGGDHPAMVMHRINRMAIRTGASATCQYAILDLERMQLEWVSAGHLPLLHVPNGGAPTLLGPSGDPLLGLDRDARFHSDHLDLAAGDILLLYTDGLVERRREHLDVGLARLVAAASTGGPLAAIVEEAIRSAPNVPREDDLCLLAVRIVGIGR